MSQPNWKTAEVGARRPFVGGQTIGPVRGSRVELIQSLCPLPDAAFELGCVSAAWRGGRSTVHVGIDATETALRRMSLDQYRVLYFATHNIEIVCERRP